MHDTYNRIAVRIALLIAPVLLAAATARGVIRIDMDLKQYKRFSSAILHGKVTAIDTTSGQVEARMSAFGRATLPNDYATLRVDLSVSPKHLKTLTVGDPLAWIPTEGSSPNSLAPSNRICRGFCGQKR